MATALQSSRDRLHHPGVEQDERRSFARVNATPVTLDLQAGETLYAGIARALDQQGLATVFITLDGMELQQLQYVIPAGPQSALHVAWYSDPHLLENVHVEHGTLVAGYKDGERFFHCHSLWQGSDGDEMGHLLNDKVVLAKSARVSGYACTGAIMEITPDPETNFPLFRIKDQASVERGNAFLLTIRPHEDLIGTIEDVAHIVGIEDASILGIGSTIGAKFDNGTVMESPLSEYQLLPGARLVSGRCEALPMACIEPAKKVFRGALLPGFGPICVTSELLLVASD
ncbi:MAG: hypothetical protein JWL66_3057 [Sphingomonadales bacterium]|nr:hypothetical protein [Sphingomonadales bacterium]